MLNLYKSKKIRFRSYLVMDAYGNWKACATEQELREVYSRMKKGRHSFTVYGALCSFRLGRPLKP